MEVPYDGPASVAFAGERVLVTNQTFPTAHPEHWAVLDVFVGERGLPLFRPFVLKPRGRKHRLPRLRLRVRPKQASVGHRTRFRFRVTLRGKPVKGAVIEFADRRAHTGRHGRAHMTFTPKHRGIRRVIVRKRGALAGTATVRFVR
jgi:hypothetical protein